MRLNRSLKEINLCSHRFGEDKNIVASTHFTALPSPTKHNSSYLDTIIGKMKDSPIVKVQDQDQVTLKKYLSQKEFEPLPLQTHRKRRKVQHQFIKTQRIMPDKNKNKQQQNQDYLKFCQQRYGRNKGPTDILTPVNRNLPRNPQAKKHRLIIKKNIAFSEEYKLGKVLGKGRFGNVYTAQHIATNFIVAAKQISLEQVTKKLVERLTWQIKIQAFVKNQYCLQLYKVCKEGNNLYLLIQHGDCSLFDRLRQKRYFSEVETCYYITQTIKALVHLHKNGIVHRDIKPQNIVLINNVVKLADFGWSIYIGEHSKRRTFCGTLDYVSPEIVLGNQYDFMVDVWSVGVLCYQLCTGHAPFESKKSREETYRKILSVDIKYPRYLSSEIKSFISSLLARNPSERMSLEQASCHPWVLKYSAAK